MRRTYEGFIGRLLAWSSGSFIIVWAINFGWVTTSATEKQKNHNDQYRKDFAAWQTATQDAADQNNFWRMVAGVTPFDKTDQGKYARLLRSTVADSTASAESRLKNWEEIILSVKTLNLIKSDDIIKAKLIRAGKLSVVLKQSLPSPDRANPKYGFKDYRNARLVTWWSLFNWRSSWFWLWTGISCLLGLLCTWGLEESGLPTHSLIGQWLAKCRRRRFLLAHHPLGQQITELESMINELIRQGKRDDLSDEQRKKVGQLLYEHQKKLESIFSWQPPAVEAPPKPDPVNSLIAAAEQQLSIVNELEQNPGSATLPKTCKPDGSLNKEQLPRIIQGGKR